MTRTAAAILLTLSAFATAPPTFADTDEDRMVRLMSSLTALDGKHITRMQGPLPGTNILEIIIPGFNKNQVCFLLVKSSVLKAAKETGELPADADLSAFSCLYQVKAY